MGLDMFAGTLGLVIMAVLLVAVILWLLLPFAVFGTKSKIDELIKINKDSNAILESIDYEITEFRKAIESQNKSLKNPTENHDQT